MFDKASPYKGKITAYDAPIYIADAALYLKTAQPDLGIDDPYSLNKEQFDASVALLKDQHTVIGEYWNDYPRRQVRSSRARPCSARRGRSSRTPLSSRAPPRCKPSSRRKARPDGATPGWSSSKAAHPNCMYMWMDYITSPAVQAQVAYYFGEAPANPKACA